MKKLFYSIIIISLTMILENGCKKLEDFGNTNINTQATNNPITSELLTRVLSNIGSYATSDGYTDVVATINGSFYCQYFSETQYPSSSIYASNKDSPMGYYSGDVYDLQNIIINNTDNATKEVAALNGTNVNQIAISRILKAYIYWTITDRWGDIPYSDALKGDPNVTYDTQETIYKDLINELSEAVAEFTTGTPILGDIVYNGDVSKWKKFANSMRMLMSLRLSKQYPGASDYAAIQFNTALVDTAGSISTNAENFVLNYPGGNFRNPYYKMYDGRHDYGESATLTTLLHSLNNDVRQNVFGAAVIGGTSTLGVPYGRNSVYINPWCAANPNYCYIFNPLYRQQTSPVYIMTASQVLLARAEAADKGWTSEIANTNSLYQNGIIDSYLQWGLQEPDAAYLSSANVVLPFAPGSGLNLQQIATQEYIAYYPDGTQGWSNWRRTSYPALTPAPDGIDVPLVIPRRYMYGTDDYALNNTGVTEAVARLIGGDQMDSRVWWDK
jgi:hypothetical protein